jgi:alpha-aminoadipate/glutamate carrier protein LysW
MSAICPECDSPIDVDEFDVDIGDELTCSECGTLLRVANDAPLEFEAADDEDEDLDDEEEEAAETEVDDADEDDLDDDEEEEDDGYKDEDE